MRVTRDVPIDALFAFVLSHERDQSAVVEQTICKASDDKLYALLIPGHGIPLMATSIYVSVMNMRDTLVRGMDPKLRGDVAEHLELAQNDNADTDSHIREALRGLTAMAMARKAAPNVRDYWLSTVQRPLGDGTFGWTLPGMFHAPLVGKSLTFTLSWESEK